MMQDWMWRAAFRVGFRVVRQWWRLRRPAHAGVLVALWHGDRVLLVRQSYRRGWSLPGGGVGRGEAADAAACRELVEELGLRVERGGLALAHEEVAEWDYRRDHVRIFELRLPAEPALRIDNREIVQARFVGAEAALSAELPPFVRTYLRRRAAPATAQAVPGPAIG